MCSISNVVRKKCDKQYNLFLLEIKYFHPTNPNAWNVLHKTAYLGCALQKYRQMFVLIGTVPCGTTLSDGAAGDARSMQTFVAYIYFLNCQ